MQNHQIHWENRGIVDEMVNSGNNEEPAGTLKTEIFIMILGKNKIQNELLLSYIRGKTGLDGICTQNIESLKENSGSSVFLIADYSTIDVDKFWVDLDLWRNAVSQSCFVTLYNVEHEMGIVKRALLNHLQGVFLKDAPLSQIPKGIDTILSGGLWYMRKSLEKLVFELTVLNNMVDNGVPASLTNREKEILTLISSGYDNRKIANELYVSLNTVKTHVYNIFRKIKVKNRFQAVLWAAKNL